MIGFIHFEDKIHINILKILLYEFSLIPKYKKNINDNKYEVDIIEI